MVNVNIGWKFVAYVPRERVPPIGNRTVPLDDVDGDGPAPASRKYFRRYGETREVTYTARPSGVSAMDSAPLRHRRSGPTGQGRSGFPPVPNRTSCRGSPL